MSWVLWLCSATVGHERGRRHCNHLLRPADRVLRRPDDLGLSWCPRPQINRPAWVFCMSCCANFEFRVMQVPRPAPHPVCRLGWSGPTCRASQGRCRPACCRRRRRQPRSRHSSTCRCRTRPRCSTVRCPTPRGVHAACCSNRGVLSHRGRRHRPGTVRHARPQPVHAPVRAGRPDLAQTGRRLAAERLGGEVGARALAGRRRRLA